MTSPSSNTEHSMDGCKVQGKDKFGSYILDSAPSATPRFSDLYPERRLSAVSDCEIESYQKYHSTFTRLRSKFIGNNITQLKCEKKIIKSLKDSPLVKLLIDALESRGCKIDVNRHIQCDMCTEGKDRMSNFGGYDPQTNQIFICANNCGSEKVMHQTFTQQLLAMFDRCANGKTMNYRNLDHLACTEIRKASLLDCDIIPYLRSDIPQKTEQSIFSIESKHASCVKETAVQFLMKSQFVDDETACRQSVDRVFDKCYSDLEPFGRRFTEYRQFGLARGEMYMRGY